MKKFTRVIEDFDCAHCGAHISGNGYTNHCPKCLWSRHVDINPGDRAADCGGMMKPVSIETKKNGFIITHKCEKCRKIAHCKSAENDDMNAIIELSKNTDFVFGGHNKRGGR
ncbi:MAG: RNHCP domain-containing protein [Rickettsiales bacterium]|jgi:hypothetical protein|nr:RNHCP domain-containing protein [Rickettsiales bacterium]